MHWTWERTVHLVDIDAVVVVVVVIVVLHDLSHGAFPVREN